MGVAAVRGRGTVIAGTGAVRAEDAIVLTRAARAVGCDGALILPPYFVKLTDDEIFAHYAAIAAAVDFPICLYNIPGNAVNALSPALVRRLAELDSVVAVKESSGDWNNYYATALAVQDRLRVFCGPSSVFGVAAVLLGADGVIDCFPNCWRPGGFELFYAARDGRLEEARRLQEIGWKLTVLFTSEGRTLYPSTKAAMEMLGLPGGTLRSPLQPLNAPQRARLRHGLIELGVIDPVAAPAAAAD
jgi:4-hydroxy-tetrahydrodipicolinate synthase